MASKRPAVFLDRDGVLTKENSYVASVKNLSIFPYTADCIRQIHNKGYYAIVVTNQSGVARGLFTEKDLLEMNQYLMERTDVDDVYYCPHHPKGRIEKYRKMCRCRKPGTKMFEMACKKYAIDMSRSYMIGDRAGDILAGQNIGIKTILLESGYGTERLEEAVVPDYIAYDLNEAVGIL